MARIEQRLCRRAHRWNMRRPGGGGGCTRRRVASCRGSTSLPACVAFALAFVPARLLPRFIAPRERRMAPKSTGKVGKANGRNEAGRTRSPRAQHDPSVHHANSGSSGWRTWPPDSPYVADTMPTLAKAPRYRSACGLARDGSPPSAAYSPVVHPPPPPTLQNLPPPHNTHSTPRPRSVQHTANL